MRGRGNIGARAWEVVGPLASDARRVLMTPRVGAGPTLFSFDYPPLDGGIARLCSELARVWRAEGRSVEVIAQSGGAGEPGRVSLDAVRPGRELGAWVRLLRAGRGLVVCATWYPEGLVALLSGRRPLVILAHGAELLPAEQAWRRPIWEPLQRWVLESADAVIANSRHTAALTSRVAPGARVRPVPLAVDTEVFRPGDRAAARARLGLSDLERVIGTVSRVHAFKGHETVLRALAAMEPSVRARVTYCVGGRGPDVGRLQALATALGVSERVRWLGFVDEADLPDLYRALDAFVMCTREVEGRRELEGFGLSFLEAQACGVPAIGARTGGIPDAIVEGDGGWMIAQDDAEALATHLRRLVVDPEAFEAMGRLARARVEREATWRAYADRFEAALTSLGVALPGPGR